MSRCEFGAAAVDGGFRPFISFTDGDKKLTFWADGILPDEDEARGLMLKLFDIVSEVRKKNLTRVSPPPRGGPYEAN